MLLEQIWSAVKGGGRSGKRMTLVLAWEARHEAEEEYSKMTAQCTESQKLSDLLRTKRKWNENRVL